jgi:hypothetical protein
MALLIVLSLLVTNAAVVHLAALVSLVRLAVRQMLAGTLIERIAHLWNSSDETSNTGGVR